VISKKCCRYTGSKPLFFGRPVGALCLGVVLGISFLACGGGGDSTPASGTPDQNGLLHRTFYRTITKAPTVTFTCSDSLGQEIPGARLRIDTTTTGPGNQTIGSYINNLEAIPEGVTRPLPVSAIPYPYFLNAQTQLVNSAANNGAWVGSYNGSYLSTVDGHVNLVSSLKTWNTHVSGLGLSSFRVDIYQCDANGNIAWGTQEKPLNPLVCRISDQEVEAADTLVAFKTELFDGYYRVSVVPTTPVGESMVSAYLSGPIHYTSASTDFDIHFPSNPNVLSMTIQLLSGDTLAPVADANSYTVALFDKASGLPLQSAVTSSGSVSIPTGSHTEVVAILKRHDGNVVAIETFSGLTPTTPTITLNQVAYQGSLSAADVTSPDYSGFMLSMDFAPFDSSYSGYFNLVDYAGAGPAIVSDSFDAVVFPGKYVHVAYGMQNFAQSAPATVTVPITGAVNDVSIPVGAGGKISGVIQDSHGNPVENVILRLIPSTSGPIELEAVSTDATGAYSFDHVPFGAYGILVGNNGGAYTSGLAVGVSAPELTKNFTKYTVLGKLTDSLQNPVPARISAGNDEASVTTDSYGAYTLKLFQGQNFVVIQPTEADTTLGFTYINPILIDDTTITTN